MSNRFREHRVRTSLEGKVAPPASDDAEVRRLAEVVHVTGRGVFFFTDQLAKMPWQSRELIEAEARRLYGNRRGGC